MAKSSFRIESKISSLAEKVREARKLGQYQLIRRLGKGGMGEVYLAEHRLMKRPCAIKLIRTDTGVQPDVVKRFEREAQLLSRLLTVAQRRSNFLNR